MSATWRALARLHMWQTGYPLHVMHGYVMPAKEAYDFSALVHRVECVVTAPADASEFSCGGWGGTCP